MGCSVDGQSRRIVPVRVFCVPAKDNGSKNSNPVAAILLPVNSAKIFIVVNSLPQGRVWISWSGYPMFLLYQLLFRNVCRLSIGRCSFFVELLKAAAFVLMLKGVPNGAFYSCPQGGLPRPPRTPRLSSEDEPSANSAISVLFLYHFNGKTSTHGNQCRRAAVRDIQSIHGR